VSDRPLISAIVPVWNCERYVAEAIDSVLAQSYRPLELVVVDDGSTDGSAEVIGRYAPAVRYHHHAHAGLGAARNAGLGLATGAYVAFLDADDVWLPGKLELQMARMEISPAPDLVFGHVVQFHSPELDERSRSRIRGDGQVLGGVFAGTMLARRDVFGRCGLFGTQWRVGEFVDWALRAREAGLRSVVVPEVVTRRRLHQTNMTRRERDGHADYARVIRESLARRRRAGGPQPGAGPGP
jgi:glycosyltransferase involved in cell wall biosynthesis